jgi:hypothetical protein
MNNSALEFALKAAIAIARHPATQKFAKHLLRQATAQLIRTVRNGSRRAKHL